MYFFSNMLLLFVVCLAGCALTLASPAGSLGESKLLLAMRSTSDLQQNNPARSLECFQYYSEIFDQLVKKYEQDYEACRNTSVQETLLMNELFKPRVSALNNTSVDSCQLLTYCIEEANTQDILACYTNVGADNIRVMYNISSLAGSYYGELLQRIQNIQFNEDLCTNTSKRNYELSADQAYINLQNCLLGLEVVPSKASIVTTEVPTVTSADPTNLSKTSLTLTSPTPSAPVRTTAVAATSSSAAPVTTASLSSELKKFLHSITH